MTSVVILGVSCVIIVYDNYTKITQNIPILVFGCVIFALIVGCIIFLIIVLIREWLKYKNAISQFEIKSDDEQAALVIMSEELEKE